ncbi:hypothetical protein DL770_002220 [Monosporascus sp. CRB-9-2]|nr:hypothetical protein DL770_002220 [Monosporascus sp. CRB-9-2]
MQFSTVLSVLAMGLMASAAPELQTRGKYDVDYCCSPLSCILLVGDACPTGHDHYHCKSDDKGKSWSLVTIKAECIKVT